jgi:hypothetical protein
MQLSLSFFYDPYLAPVSSATVTANHLHRVEVGLATFTIALVSELKLSPCLPIIGPRHDSLALLLKRARFEESMRDT